MWERLKIFFFFLLNVCVYSLCHCVVAHNDPQQSVLGNTLSLKRGAATEHYRQCAQAYVHYVLGSGEQQLTYRT